MVYDLAAASTRASVTSTPPAEVTVTVVPDAVVTSKRTTFLVVVPVVTLGVSLELWAKSRLLDVIAVAAVTAEVEDVCDATSVVLKVVPVVVIATTVIVDAPAGVATRPVRARAAAAATAISFLDI
jgi:hypothetical protein